MNKNAKEIGWFGLNMARYIYSDIWTKRENMGYTVLFLSSTQYCVRDQMTGVKQLVNPYSNKIIYHGLLRNILLEYSNTLKWVLVYGVECIFYKEME